MTLRTTLIVHAIVTGAFGLAFALVPVWLLSLYAVSVGPGGALMGQYFGVTLLAWAAVSIGLAVSDTTAVRRGVAIAYVAGSAIGGVLSLIAVLDGSVNALGWSTVAIYAGLVAIFSLHIGGP